ncbi:oxidoreductase [Rhodococcoides trifolii]|uniref:Oxidoreductase n=2 Tax=Rhodococcoides trifolii TaxID=908250 RepID=A0A917LF86_9NOCA|nr:oxidoreductase [Rhodococcus trifolii]
MTTPWMIANVVDKRVETPSAHTLVLDVDGWPGHLAGQHVDVRLTAEDGYSAQRSYSIASARNGGRVELTVQTVPDGEVSPYLADVVEPGDQLELRGPIGGWFVWNPDSTRPVLLVGGGSGIVPLRAMLRARHDAGSRALFRLVYSVREPMETYFADEFARPDPVVDVHFVHTRRAPVGSRRPVGRLGIADLNTHGWPPDFEPDCFVCGPTGFVETAANILVALGHEPRRIRTERFGPT